MSTSNEGMHIYNEYKEETRQSSQSSRVNCPLNPQRNSPRPESFGRGASYPYVGNHAHLEENFLLITNNLDEKTAIMVPGCYEDGFCRVADTEWHESPCVERCVKTCAAYQYIGESHPRLAQYAGRDPWTDMPLFQRPSGPSLDKFLREHHDLLYMAHGDTSTCRPHPEYLPLMYQWALQALSAILFCHQHNVLVGLFGPETFWTSFPHLSVSLIGFVSASFTDDESKTYESDINGLPPFNPFDELPEEAKDPCSPPTTSVGTDLFIYGTLLYELMTAGVPDIYTSEEEATRKEEWPHIERRHLGEIVTKCWEYQYESAQEVKDDIVEVLQHEDWEVEGEDTLKGFDAAELLQGHLMEQGSYGY